MFSQGFASGLMSIREESPGRTGRFQGFAEPLAGNVLHDAACPGGRRSRGKGRGAVTSLCSLQRQGRGCYGSGGGRWLVPSENNHLRARMGKNW